MAAPSIHMNMTAPTGNMEYFYTEVTVPPGGDPLYTYYMTSGNGQGIRWYTDQTRQQSVGSCSRYGRQ
nr:DUF5077 domain-containing protein [Sphingobacterium multivorum]